MKLNTGKVEFLIEFDNGSNERIFFNPNDRDFVNRINEFEKNTNERIQSIDFERYKEKLQKEKKINIKDIDSLYNLSPEEFEELKNTMQTVHEIDAEYQEAVKIEINRVFGYDISEKLFKFCQPLDMVIIEENGEEKSVYFIIHFLENFSRELQKHQEKVNSAMNKHIGKYKK